MCGRSLCSDREKKTPGERSNMHFSGPEATWLQDESAESREEHGNV